MVESFDIDIPQQAIARLRAYCPPPTHYYSLPLSRRAAVLILLFADRYGDLRVVLTMRANTLKSYAGQAALPGGKADSLSETAFQTARREAYEEIGLPLEDSKMPPPFRVEHLCQLPMNLARTELGVRPTVAFISSTNSTQSGSTGTTETNGRAPSVEEALIPRLDAKEVAAVFSAPFHNFLRATDEKRGHIHTTASASPPDGAGVEAAGFPSGWYKGTWTDWHESRWRMHNFYVPVAGQTVTRPPPEQMVSPLPYRDRSPSTGDDPLAGLSRFRVFGMTARIMVDAARVAYGEDPEFEHNSHFGDEEMIERLMRMGRLGPIRRRSDEITKEDMVAASKL
ncbi:hypothetical protein NA57DRAFT_37535 [Rhizodiscina lignyota]|uniref:Nudix hydrolase domain-containing protein n=1 Tax=Rhizodiscina lignyota TaxID=1504668 RepID=A0A9P4IER7_9PEZI|nr:hypothetical protein NA57DRAFT_37535 [Rhizodiscina lignyota]